MCIAGDTLCTGKFVPRQTLHSNRQAMNIDISLEDKMCTAGDRYCTNTFVRRQILHSNRQPVYDDIYCQDKLCTSCIKNGVIDFML